MLYNKNRFQKTNDKKVLHKVRKHWVVLSLAMLMAIGGGAVATHTVASADETPTITAAKATPSSNDQSIASSALSKPAASVSATNNLSRGAPSQNSQSKSVSVVSNDQVNNANSGNLGRSNVSSTPNLSSQSTNNNSYGAIQHPNGVAHVDYQDSQGIEHNNYYYFLQYDVGAENSNKIQTYPLIVKTPYDKGTYYDPYKGFKLQSGKAYDANNYSNRTSVNYKTGYIELYRNDNFKPDYVNVTIPAQIDLISGSTGQPQTKLDNSMTEPRSYTTTNTYVGEPVPVPLDDNVAQDGTAINNAGYDEENDNMTAVVGTTGNASFWLPRRVQYTVTHDSQNNHNPVMVNAPTNNQSSTVTYDTTHYVLKSRPAGKILINFVSNDKFVGTETLPQGYVNDFLSGRDYHLVPPNYFTFPKGTVNPDFTYKSEDQYIKIPVDRISTKHTYQIPFYAQEIDAQTHQPIKGGLREMYAPYSTSYNATNQLWFPDNPLPLPDGVNGQYELNGSVGVKFNASYDPNQNRQTITFIGTAASFKTHDSIPVFNYIKYNNQSNVNLMTNVPVNYNIYAKQINPDGTQGNQAVYGKPMASDPIEINQLAKSIKFPDGKSVTITQPNQVPFTVPDGTQIVLNRPGNDTFGNWPFADGEWSTDQPITVTFHANAKPTFSMGKTKSGAYYHLWAREVQNLTINFVNQANQSVKKINVPRWYQSGILDLDTNHQQVVFTPMWNLPYYNEGPVPTNFLSYPAPKGYQLDLNRLSNVGHSGLHDNEVMNVYVIGNLESFITQRKSDGVHMWVLARDGDVMGPHEVVEPGNGLTGGNQTIAANESVPFKIQQVDANGHTIAEYDGNNKDRRPDNEEVLTNFSEPINFSELHDLVDYANHNWTNHGYHLITPSVVSQVIPDTNSVSPVTWTYAPNRVSQAVPVMIINEDPSNRGYKVTRMYSPDPEPSFSGLVGQARSISPNNLSPNEYNQNNVIYHPIAGGVSLQYNPDGAEVIATNNENLPSSVSYNGQIYPVKNGQINVNGVDYYPFIYKSPATPINVKYVNQVGATVKTDQITGAAGARWDGQDGSYNNTTTIDNQIPAGYYLDTTKGNRDSGYQGDAIFPTVHHTGSLTVYVKGQTVTTTGSIDVFPRYLNNGQWIDNTSKLIMIPVTGQIGSTVTLTHNGTPVSGNDTLDQLEPDYKWDADSDPMQLLITGEGTGQWQNLPNGHLRPAENYDVINGNGTIKIVYEDDQHGNIPIGNSTTTDQIGHQFDPGIYLNNQTHGGFLPNGYDYDHKHSSRPLKFSNVTQTWVVYVKPVVQTGTVDVQYQDPQGHPVAQNLGQNYQVTGPSGQAFNINEYEGQPYVPQDYQYLKTVNAPTQFSNGSQTATIEVGKLTAINVEYEDANTYAQIGNSLTTHQEPESTGFDIKRYDGNGYLPNGYHFVGNAVNNPTTYEANQPSAIVYVQPNSATEDIHYIYHGHNEGNTSLNGYYGGQGDETNGSGMSLGYHLASSSNGFTYANGTADDNVNVLPNSASVTIDYQYQGSTVASDSSDFHGNDSRAIDAGNNGVDITSANDSGMPAYYHLARANNSFSYDDGTHDVAILPDQATDIVKYQVSASGAANNGSVIGSNAFTGNDDLASQANDTSFDVTSANASGMPFGYRLIKPDNPFNYDNGTHYVPVAPVTVTVPELDTITRTIYYEDAQTGQFVAKPVVQTVTYKGNVTADAATNRTASDWQAQGTNQWPEQPSFDLTSKGYGKPDIATVPTETVPAGSSDSTVIIKYPENISQNTNVKAITRTIHYQDARTDAQLAKPQVQSVIYTQSVITNQVTGRITSSNWQTQGTDQWPSVSVPKVNGYETPNNVNTVIVTPDDKDITIDVDYNKQPTPPALKPSSSGSVTPPNSSASRPNSSSSASMKSNQASSASSENSAKPSSVSSTKANNSSKASANGASSNSVASHSDSTSSAAKPSNKSVNHSSSSQPASNQASSGMSGHANKPSSSSVITPSSKASTNQSSASSASVKPNSSASSKSNSVASKSSSSTSSSASVKPSSASIIPSSESNSSGSWNSSAKSRSSSVSIPSSNSSSNASSGMSSHTGSANASTKSSQSMPSSSAAPVRKPSSSSIVPSSSSASIKPGSSSNNASQSAKPSSTSASTQSTNPSAKTSSQASSSVSSANSASSSAKVASSSARQSTKSSSVTSKSSNGSATPSSSKASAQASSAARNSVKSRVSNSSTMPSSVHSSSVPTNQSRQASSLVSNHASSANAPSSALNSSTSQPSSINSQGDVSVNSSLANPSSISSNVSSVETSSEVASLSESSSTNSSSSDQAYLKPELLHRSKADLNDLRSELNAIRHKLYPNKLHQNEDLKESGQVRKINWMEYLKGFSRARKDQPMNVRNASYRLGYHDFVQMHYKQMRHNRQQRLPQTNEAFSHVGVLSALLMLLSAIFSRLAWRRKHNE